MVEPQPELILGLQQPGGLHSLRSGGIKVDLYRKRPRNNAILIMMRMMIMMIMLMMMKRMVQKMRVVFQTSVVVVGGFSHQTCYWVRVRVLLKPIWHFRRMVCIESLPLKMHLQTIVCSFIFCFLHNVVDTHSSCTTSNEDCLLKTLSKYFHMQLELETPNECNSSLAHCPLSRSNCMYFPLMLSPTKCNYWIALRTVDNPEQSARRVHTSSTD